MEVGQIIHNNPCGVSSSDFTAALVSAIRDELSRVYWNVNQKQWAGSPHDSWSSEELSYTPLPPGIQWCGYYNWGGSPEDDDWDQGEADKPNFSFEGVEVRWYKRFGRSMNVNVVWPAEKWLRWFERCMQTIYAYESQNVKHSHDNLIPYPKPDGAVGLSPEPEDLRYVELMEKVDTLEAQLNSIACVCIDVSENEKPRVDKDDWRWCQTLEWVTKLGLHALTAKTKFQLFQSHDSSAPTQSDEDKTK